MYVIVNSGHIEMSGQPVDSFTQQDIDSGVISYVHGTNNEKQLNKTSIRLTLQVSFLSFILFFSYKIKIWTPVFMNGTVKSQGNLMSFHLSMSFLLIAQVCQFALVKS